MKIYRSTIFKTYNPTIWKSDVLTVGKRDGSLFIAKSIFTGFSINLPEIKVGPFKLRQYNQKLDKELGVWSAKCCIVELTYQDRKTEKPQKTSVSMYVEPYWLMHSFYLALQLMIDSWIGMMRIYYFAENGEEVGSFDAPTQVADSFRYESEPTISNIDKNELISLIKAQYGGCEKAIDRYSKACSKTVEDALVDFVITLDGLLGYRIHREIAYRIAARGAFLLSKNKEERRFYYDSFKYLYDLRSRIVHGDIDEVVPPSLGSKEQKALAGLGVNLSQEYLKGRYQISNFARDITKKVLLFFIANEDKLDKGWLGRLELGLETS